MLKQSWGRVRESGGDRQVNLWGMGKDQTILENVTRHTIGGSYNTAYPNWLQSCLPYLSELVVVSLVTESSLIVH